MPSKMERSGRRWNWKSLRCLRKVDSSYHEFSIEEEEGSCVGAEDATAALSHSFVTLVDEGSGSRGSQTAGEAANPAAGCETNKELTETRTWGEEIDMVGGEPFAPVQQRSQDERDFHDPTSTPSPLWGPQEVEEDKSLPVMSSVGSPMMKLRVSQLADLVDPFCEGSVTSTSNSTISTRPSTFLQYYPSEDGNPCSIPLQITTDEKPSTLGTRPMHDTNSYTTPLPPLAKCSQSRSFPPSSAAPVSPTKLPPRPISRTRVADLLLHSNSRRIMHADHGDCRPVLPTRSSIE